MDWIHFKEDNLLFEYVDCEEMIDMGYIEVIKGGRLFYHLDIDVMAAECRSCGSLKRASAFSLSNQEFSGLRRDCRSCDSQKRKLTDSYITQDYNNRRRARKKSLPAHETSEQRLAVWERFGSTCALTGDAINIHADHAIPLNTGRVGTVFGNMYPLSGYLNTSKSDNHIFEWFDANKRRFKLSQQRFDDLIEYLASINGMTTQEYRKYTDWVFDNPLIYNEETDELVFVEKEAIT